jgi:alpha-tubulin suppressor-like RCC1 family protein
MALDSTGEVYVWGNLQKNQLNTTSARPYTSLPIHLNFTSLDSQIVSISVAASTNALTTAKNTTYTWGLPFLSAPLPYDITIQGQYCLGGQYIVMIDKTNPRDLWVAGRNEEGQLGDASRINRPQLVPVSIDVPYTHAVKVVCGLAYTLVLLNDSTIIGFGHDGYGQLASGRITSRPIPFLLDFGDRKMKTSINRVYGRLFSNMIISDDGKGVGWGYNTYGILGDSTTSTKPVPSDVDVRGILHNKVIDAISVGNGHSLAISDGMVYAWGNNFAGQLVNYILQFFLNLSG